MNAIPVSMNPEKSSCGYCQRREADNSRLCSKAHSVCVNPVGNNRLPRYLPSYNTCSYAVRDLARWPCSAYALSVSKRERARLSRARVIFAGSIRLTGDVVREDWSACATS